MRCAGANPDPETNGGMAPCLKNQAICPAWLVASRLGEFTEAGRLVPITDSLEIAHTISFQSAPGRHPSMGGRE